MRLLVTTTSPYARKVRVWARESDVQLEEQVVSPLDDDPELLRFNPLGKVPVLLTEDGPLMDSRAILDHLGARIEGLTDRVVEATAEGVLDCAVSVTMERRRPAERISEDALARSTQKIARALAAIRPALGADAFGRAEIAVACALGYLDFRMPEVLWREQRPDLAEVYARWAARPSMVQTLPPASF